MSAGGSVSEWIGQLKAGEETALQKIHQRYWPALVELARRKLKGAPGGCVDEEDVAQEAFWSFYRSLRAGRVPQLDNRHDLLALLTHIIACKAVNQIKHELVQKRGGGQVLAGSALDVLADEGAGANGPGPAGVPARTPLDQALVNDFYQYYLNRLSVNLRDFAEFYLAGCTHKETADRLGCSLRSVERKIALILERWRQMAAESVRQDIEVMKPC